MIGATNQPNVLYDEQEMLDERQSCNQEEVNYTLPLQTYAYDASQKGFRKLSIITVGSDVVVIALRYLFFTLFQ